jgi:hypothetical protein
MDYKEKYRLDKGHTEGLEPKVTESIVGTMARLRWEARCGHGPERHRSRRSRGERLAEDVGRRGRDDWGSG